MNAFRPTTVDRADPGAPLFAEPAPADAAAIEFAAPALAPRWRWARVDGPLGTVLLLADDDALTGLHFVGSRHVPGVVPGWIEDPSHPPIALAVRQLAQWCAGERDRFELPLRLHGTAFQHAVWRAIARVPPGATTSYAALAAAAGNARAVRAAGAATGRNPVSIVVPCHRVMGAGGAITGYAGGIERKRALLSFEAMARAGRRGALALGG
jgi:methylated-DNA-[protein]-cysteine S-methyltransferase